MCFVISLQERRTKYDQFSPWQLESHHTFSIFELSHPTAVCRTATQFELLDTFQSCPFSKLSIEIIQDIARLLPLFSAASFALCCRTMASIIGTQYWQKLRLLEGPRLILCQLLERDIPDHIFCYRCRILHRPGRVDAPCMKDEIRHGRLHIVFPEFQMAMKRHRLGLGAKDYLDKLAGTLTELRKGYTYQSITAARIVSSNLLVRAKHLFLLPRPFQYFPRDRGITVCAHLIFDPTRPYCFPDRLGALLQCRMRHWQDAKACPLDICVGMKKCFYCHTEICIGVQYSGCGVTIVVTAWREFGDGDGDGHAAEDAGQKSKWRTQSGFDVTLVNKQRREAKFTAGSIRSRFEHAKISL